MKLHNREDNLRGTIFTSLHKNDFIFIFYLNSCPFCLLRVLGAVMIPRLVLITVFYVSFSSWSLLLWTKHFHSLLKTRAWRDTLFTETLYSRLLDSKARSFNQIIREAYVKWQMHQILGSDKNQTTPSNLEDIYFPG